MAARQNLVNTLTRNNEAHNYNVQVQVRQLENKKHTRLFKDKGNYYRDSLRKQIKLLKISENFGVTEVTSEVWRRAEQAHDSRTELGLQALRSRDIAQQQSQEYAGQQQHLTRLVQETQQYREMFDESRATQSATGPEFERLRQRLADLLRKVRSQNNDRATIDAL